MAHPRPNRFLRLLYRAPVFLYRWHCGWLLGRRFLLLDHTGRRSGLRRSTVLEVVEYRPRLPEAVVISAYGFAAEWLRNIEAGGEAEMVVGTRRCAVEHRFLGEDEAMRALSGYLRRNRLIAPIVRFGFSRFLGWRFDGSEAAVRRLVRQLPSIALGCRPRPP
jgi:deazaflavin-dependent oxidoreductase (nitroreductase family)